MLVIHPKDRTTAMLSVLYAELGATVIGDNRTTKEIGRLLHHVSSQERIMLLGHGTENGLFFREDDSCKEFDGIIVGHSHAYHLRKHGGNLVGIWCHADDFARKEGLHGLFSGMIISEVDEAEEYGISVPQCVIDEENGVMFGKLRGLLDEGLPLHEIPERMEALNDAHTPIADFNYSHFFYF